MGAEVGGSADDGRDRFPGSGRASEPAVTRSRVGKVLAVLLTAVVIVEIVLVVGIAASLFWIGGTGTTAVGVSMLVVALVGGVLALRAMRPRR